MKVSAVIMARKGSKRIPGKMYKRFKGNTLVEHKINQLLKTNVDEIIVGSDDIRLKKIVEKYNNKKVIFLKRPKKYCIESATINSAVSNLLSLFDTDLILWAHLTNPFTNEKHYNESLGIFFRNIKRHKYDSVFSVSQVVNYFWGLDKIPINHNPNEKVHTILSTKKIKPLYVDNGSIFIRFHKDMKKDGKFWGKNGYMYIMSEKDGWDINKPWDLEACQLNSFEDKFN